MKEKSERRPINTWTSLEDLDRMEGHRKGVAVAFEGNIKKICEATLPSDGLLLDIGAGRGALRKRMPPAFADRSVHADISSTFMSAFRSDHPDAHGVAADARALPFPNESFHGVISLSTLHTLDDLGSAVAEAHRVLKPGGTFTHILDIVPLPDPIIDSVQESGHFLFPAKPIIDPNGTIHPAYYVPTAREILKFMQETPDIDPTLVHQIYLISKQPHAIFEAFARDKRHKLQEEFGEKLEGINFPGEVVPMTELFQRRLVAELHEKGFGGIVAAPVSDTQFVSSLENIQDEPDDKFPTNGAVTVLGSEIHVHAPSIPPGKFFVRSTVQLVTATKLR